MPTCIYCRRIAVEPFPAEHDGEILAYFGLRSRAPLPGIDQLAELNATPMRHFAVALRRRFSRTSL